VRIRINTLYRVLHAASFPIPGAAPLFVFNFFERLKACCCLFAK